MADENPYADFRDVLSGVVAEVRANTATTAALKEVVENQLASLSSRVKQVEDEQAEAKQWRREYTKRVDDIGRERNTKTAKYILIMVLIGIALVVFNVVQINVVHFP